MRKRPILPQASENTALSLEGLVLRELSAGVRKSEKVSLPNPIMPIDDGFGG